MCVYGPPSKARGTNRRWYGFGGGNRVYGCVCDEGHMDMSVMKNKRRI